MFCQLQKQFADKSLILPTRCFQGVSRPQHPTPLAMALPACLVLIKLISFLTESTHEGKKSGTKRGTCDRTSKQEI